MNNCTIDTEIRETQKKLTEKNREAQVLHSHLEHLNRLKEPLEIHLAGHLCSYETSFIGAGAHHSERQTVNLEFVVHGKGGNGKIKMEMSQASIDDLRKMEDRARRGIPISFYIKEY